MQVSEIEKEKKKVLSIHNSVAWGEKQEDTDVEVPPHSHHWGHVSPLHLHH